MMQFYDDETFLCDVAAEFLVNGLQNHEQVVVVAIPRHQHKLKLALQDRRWNIDEAQRSGRIEWRDATEVLQQIRVDGRLDPLRVMTLLGELLRHCKVSGSARRTRLYAEVAGLLWEEGQLDACEQLEASWAQLADSHHFSLLCSYRVASDRAITDVPLRRICGLHSHVLPTENGTAGRGKLEDRLRHLFLLEHHVRVLEGALTQAAQCETSLRQTVDGIRDRIATAKDLVQGPLLASSVDLERLEASVQAGDRDGALTLIQRLRQDVGLVRGSLEELLDRRGAGKSSRPPVAARPE